MTFSQDFCSGADLKEGAEAGAKEDLACHFSLRLCHRHIPQGQGLGGIFLVGGDSGKHEIGEGSVTVGDMASIPGQISTPATPEGQRSRGAYPIISTSTLWGLCSMTEKIGKVR